MIIYRIEDSKNNEGPYGIAVDWETRIHSPENGCPGPSTDFDFNVNKKYFYGFDSIIALKKWFTKEEIKNLISQGYRINKYKAPAVRCRVGKSGLQLIFDKSHAVLITLN